MRSIIILVLVMAGCASPARRLREEADAQNKTAFNSKITATVHLCKPHDPACAGHHGLWSPTKNDIHLSWQWVYEPSIYLRGALAHEMIHAYLTACQYAGTPGKVHDWRFQQERERVAPLLGLPVWAIPDGKRIDKLDASWDLAALENFLSASRASAGLNPATGDWPSTIYDVDLLEGEP
jgi:hypothetical protein